MDYRNSNIVKNAKIILRNDTSLNWASEEDNILLQRGEPAIEFDENNNAKLKIGDGFRAWSELPYLVTEGGNTEGGGEVVIPDNIQEQMNTLTELVNSFDIRIQNAESSANAAVLASEEIREIVDQLLIDVAASAEAQNVAIAEMKTTVEKAVDTVEGMLTDIESIKFTQEQQEQKIDTANNRVDILVSNFTDDAEFDNAELVDIRAGYDGKTYESAGAAVRQIGYDLNALGENLEGALGKDIVDGLVYEGNQLYLTSNGEKVGEAVTVIGGGGGSSSQTYTINLTNLLDKRDFVVSENEKCILKFSYHSIDDDGYDDGPGIGQIFIDQVLMSTIPVSQGNNEIDITSLLNNGTNTVRIKVINSEDSSKILAYQINKLILSVTSTAQKMATYTGDSIIIPYTVTGAGEKLVRCYLDEREFFSETVVTSGAGRQIVLPKLTDGAHILEIQAETSNGLEVMYSNKLQLGILYYSETTTTQAILLLKYEGPEEIEQGTILKLPYMVYDPFLQTTNINLNIYDENGKLYNNSLPLQVDQAPKEWVISDYPSGKVKFEIVCHDTVVSQVINVKPTSFKRELFTEGCLLNFNANGRSNLEDNPEYWEDNGVKANFEGFGWANVDGWINTENGQTALRFLPGDTMEIEYTPFDKDLKTNGYTIEAEFKTHNVRDYDSIIIDVLDQGQGFCIKSQSAELSSQNSSLNVQFKEDSRIRVTFIIEPTSLYRLVYIYINGIMSRVIQYDKADIFKQDNPVNILLGSESCGFDLYLLRMYNRTFTRAEQLNNFICDRPTLAEKIQLDKDNQILDDNEQITIAKLPMYLPYIILETDRLPKTKGDKLPDRSVTYVEPLHPTRNFTATGVQLDVQGTSSAHYPVKNYKVSLKKGLTYTNNGEYASGFPIFEDGLLGKNICLKADFASSEQANNVCLVDYYEELCPYKNPAQTENELVRTAVRGFPCAVFWKNTDTNEVTFMGKYNFNDDKSNENVFGFDKEKYPNCECVEFRTNGNLLTQFQSDDYETLIKDEDGNLVPAWTVAFEYRFPDKHTDYTNFKRVTDWVYSTWTRNATNKELEVPIRYKLWSDSSEDNSTVEFTHDTEDYRLSKFKAEFDQYFIKEAMTFFFLFTEVFLLVDNRAKNMFLTTFDGEHWFPIPYDMDSALGINNEGLLDFEYDLEENDSIHGDAVFNCADSTLWKNFIKVFKNDVATMYRSLRSGDKFNYEYINNKMLNHQKQWPIALWNEDEYNKYIGSFINASSNHLSKLQGDKSSQRDWWLFNGFKYRDSKYAVGDARSNEIYIRMYNPEHGFTITPYQHLHPRVQYDNNLFVMYDQDNGRVKRNQTVTLANPVDGVAIGDFNVYIHSADRLASVGDLAPLKVGDCDFSKAIKLQEIIVGSDKEGYSNPRLENLTVGNNELLTLVNVTNCNSPNFKTLDLSGCHGLETLLAEGTNLTSVNFPNGGHLSTVKLPASITSLTIQNQKNIKTLSLQNQENLTSLYIEETPGLPIESLINNSPIKYARLTNIEWNATDEASLRVTIDKLMEAGGLDTNYNTLDKAVVTGRVYIKEISNDFLEKINDHFPELIVVIDGVAQYFIRYADWNNKLLYRYIAEEGTSAIDPIEKGYIQIPVRENTDVAQYTYKKWSELPEKINRPYSIIAQYSGVYMATFYDANEKIIYQNWFEEGANVTDPITAGWIAAPRKESTDKYDYYYHHWTPSLENISKPTYFYPVFDEKIRSYTVYFTDEGGLSPAGHIYATCEVQYGGKAVFPGDTNMIHKYINGEPSEYYDFAGWSSNIEKEITKSEIIIAQFSFCGFLEESWADIVENCKKGNIANYNLGARKRHTFTYSGKEITVEMEIVGINHDELEQPNSEYNNGATTAALTWITYVVVPILTNVNSTSKNWSGIPGEGHQSGGGWELSDLRAEFNGALLNALDDTGLLQANIKSVAKISDHGRYHPNERVITYDKVWAPSNSELNYEASSMVVPNQGIPYRLYTDSFSRKKYMYDNKDNYIAVPYWTRSSHVISHQWYYVPTTGSPTSISAGNKQICYMCFGFCL